MLSSRRFHLTTSIQLSGIVLIIIGLIIGSGRADAKTAHEQKVERQVIVWFKKGTSAAEREKAREGARVTVLDGGQVDHHLQLVRPDPEVPTEEAIRQLKKSNTVLIAEHDDVVEAQGVPPPDDPEFKNQWALENTRQLLTAPGNDPATAGPRLRVLPQRNADMDLLGALGVLRRVDDTKDVIVAVIDSGVDSTHPDIKANMWHNPHQGREEAKDGEEGIDLVDQEPAMIDTYGHGTFAAGIIAADTDNRIGVAGVAVNHAKIMAIRQLRKGGNGLLFDTAQGMLYAAQNGAKIVNASLVFEESDVVEKVIKDHPNMLVVAAAGNEGVDVDRVDGPIEDKYPCSYLESNVICVANTNQGDQLSKNSNYGEVSVDLGAPGSDILSLKSLWSRSVEFEDGFEDSNASRAQWDFGSDWEISNTDPIAGAYSARTTSDQGYLTLHSGLNLTKMANCDLTYKSQATLPTEVKIEVEERDGLWKSLPSGYASSDLNEWNRVSLPSEPDVRFRLQLAPFRSEKSTLVIDDIKVTCDKRAEPSPQSYEYDNGTSFAAPQVSGIAALLLSVKPDATMAELRKALLEGGDNDVFLSNKTTSGARANANNSLRVLLNSERFPVHRRVK